MTQIIYFTLDTNPTLDTLDTIYIYTPGGSAEGSQGPALARRVDLALGGGEAAGSEICKQMFRQRRGIRRKKEPVLSGELSLASLCLTLTLIVRHISAASFNS